MYQFFAWIWTKLHTILPFSLGLAKIADNLLPSGFENKMPELDVFRSWTIGPNMELFREFEEDSLDVISEQSLNLQEGSDTLLAIFRILKKIDLFRT